MSRKPLDLYATPPEVARAIVSRLAQTIAPAQILEPSAGPGRFVTAALAQWPDAPVLAVDVDGAHEQACMEAGAVEFVHDDWPAFAARADRTRDLYRSPLLVLGNPPFSHAQRHVQSALSLLRDGEHLAFVLRLSFLGANERIGFWERTPLLSLALILPRPSYVDDGNDSTESALFVWRKGFTGRATLEPPILHGSVLAERTAAQGQLGIFDPRLAREPGTDCRRAQANAGPSPLPSLPSTAGGI